LATRAEIGRMKRERTRAMLVAAAMRAFARLGPDATSIDDVILEAGVSHGTFYNYFDTQDDLLAAVAVEISDQLLLNTELQRQLADPADRVACAVRIFIRLAAADPVRGWLIVRIALVAAPLGDIMQSYMTGDINAGLAAGRFKNCSPQVAADVVLGLGLMGMRSVLRGDANAGHAEDIAEAVLLALGVDDAGAVARYDLDDKALAGRGRALG
jgi:AcrR family transcriptional regulator